MCTQPSPACRGGPFPGPRANAWDLQRGREASGVIAGARKSPSRRATVRMADPALPPAGSGVTQCDQSPAPGRPARHASSLGCPPASPPAPRPLCPLLRPEPPLPGQGSPAPYFALRAPELQVHIHEAEQPLCRAGKGPATGRLRLLHTPGSRFPFPVAGERRPLRSGPAAGRWQELGLLSCLSPH